MLPDRNNFDDLLHRITYEVRGRTGIENARMNLEATKSGWDILELPQHIPKKGDKAVVVAAGPSLHRREMGPRLRKYADRVTIIAAGASLYHLLKHDVIPDVIVEADPQPNEVRYFGDPSLDDATLHTDDYFRRQDYDFDFREDERRVNSFLIGRMAEIRSQTSVALGTCVAPALVARLTELGFPRFWWNPLFDYPDEETSLTRQVFELNGITCLNTFGNTGAAAWVIAHSVLDKTRVALIGMDFAYHPDTTYEQSEYYHELLALSDDQSAIEFYSHLRGIDGRDGWFTDPVLLWYRNELLKAIPAAPCETHNCTEGGILFGKHIRLSTLEEFCAR